MAKEKKHFKTIRFTPKGLVKYYQELVDTGVIPPNGAGAERLNYFKSLIL
jgi:hypothetical protein